MEGAFISTFAYAKVNLALAVIGKRDDGFHELQSVMQSIELHDVVRIKKSGRKIICRCGELSGQENLAYKAADLYLNYLRQSVGIEIEIEKHIPVQAGLAGGSSDAAAVLGLLNQLFGTPVNADQLKELAAQLGADVAFCFRGGTMWASGLGEKLEELMPAPHMDLVIVKPDQGINTGEAYRGFDHLGQNGKELNRELWEKALTNGRIKEVGDLLRNDLEQVSVQMVPEIAGIKEGLLRAGCYGALMSGSGSAVFGIAKDPRHAEEVARMLREQGYKQVWTSRTRERDN